MNAARLAGLLVVALGLPAVAFPPVPKPKETPATGKELAKALRGTWEVAKIERGRPGKVGNPPGYALRVAIDGEKLTQTTVLDGRELRPIPSTFVVDVKKTPPTFELKYTLGKSKEVSIKGILSVKGDQMIWAYATGDGKVPEKVDAKLTPLQHRFTLKRIKQ